MKTVLEYFINESFKVPQFTEIDKQLKANSGDKYRRGMKSFKDFYRLYNFEWSEITPDHITTLKAPFDDADRKRVRNIVAGKQSGIVFSIVDGKYTWTVDSNRTGHQLAGELPYNIRYTSKSIPTIKEFTDTLLDKSDELMLLELNGFLEYSSYSKQNQRDKNKDGIVLQGDPNYYKNVAKENLKRYNKIIAQHKSEKKKDEIDDLLVKGQTAVAKVFDLMREAVESPEKYQNVTYDIERLNEIVYSSTSYDRGRVIGNDGIMILSKQLVSISMRLSTQSSYSNPESDLRGLENIKKKLQDKIDMLNIKIKDIESKVRS